MALPKAVLCILGDEPAEHPAEDELRSVGFATFSITWKELEAEQNGWTQILPPLDDPTVVAWAIVGKPEDFTDSVRSKVALLTLAMKRQAPPATAFIVIGDGDIRDVPYALDHIQIYRNTEKFAVKLLVAKVKPQVRAPLPFHVKAHLDPLIGVWLEVAPPVGETWDGFMAGVTNAEVVAFGVGPGGVIPRKAILHYPILGINGQIGDVPFNACAAKNTLSPEASCFMRLNGAPGNVICLDYPEEDPSAQKGKRTPVQVELA